MQLSGTEKFELLAKVLDAALAIEWLELRLDVLLAVVAQLNSAEKDAALDKVIEDAFLIHDKEKRMQVFTYINLHRNKINPALHVKYLKYIGKEKRDDFLDYSSILFAILPLQSKTFVLISKSILEICTSWEWL